MLKEKALPRTTQWERALSQFIYDGRYTALPKQYRKMVYEDFMKKNSFERMREELRIKQDVGRKMREMMQEYLDSGKITAGTEYRQFEELAKHDPRFISAIQMDREALLSEFVMSVKRAKDDRTNRLMPCN